jgi:cytochrome c-type biogenesis protein CcmF
MKNPDIANLVTKDLYLSPMGIDEKSPYSPDQLHSFKKGEVKDINGLKVKFVDFDMSKFNREEMASGKENIMAAQFEITLDGKTETLIAEQHISTEGSNSIPARLPGNDNFTFLLVKTNVAGESSVELAVIDETQPALPEAPETLVLTASIKPFINFVWGGTIVMVIGFFFALTSRYRRMKSESRKLEVSISNGTNGNGQNGKHRHKSHKKEHSEEV